MCFDPTTILHCLDHGHRQTTARNRRGRQPFRRGRFVLALLLFTLGVHQSRVVRAQEERQLFVRVYDAAGDLITDLTAQDFVIQHGGVECKVVRVELINEPLRLTLLVDDADGADPYFRFLRNGLPTFVNALPETSQVALVLLSGRPRVVVDHSEGLAKVQERLGGLFTVPGSSAGFFDGLREAVERFLEDDARWPVVALVTTDGASNRATFTPGKYDAFLDHLNDSAVTVHALSLHAVGGDFFQQGIARDVTQMARGWYDTLNSPSPAVSAKLTEMATEISLRHAASNQYLVVYELPPDAEPSDGASAGVHREQVTMHVSLDGRPGPTPPTGLTFAVAMNEIEAGIGTRQAQVKTLEAEIAALQRDAIILEESSRLGQPIPQQAGGAVGAAVGSAIGGGGREGFWNAGELAFASGNLDEAVTFYEQAHQEDPNWGKPLFKLALVALNKGDTETAVGFFEQVVAVDPSSAEGTQASEFIAQLRN